MKTIEESCRVGRRRAGAIPGSDGTNPAGRKDVREQAPDMASLGRSTGGDRVSHAAVRNMMAVQTELRRQGARIQ